MKVLRGECGRERWIGISWPGIFKRILAEL